MGKKIKRRETSISRRFIDPSMQPIPSLLLLYIQKIAIFMPF
jgi:hypothetical protein